MTQSPPAHRRVSGLHKLTICRIGHRVGPARAGGIPLLLLFAITGKVSGQASQLPE